MTKIPGLICAFHIGASGKAQFMSGNGAPPGEEEAGWSWININREAPGIEEWLTDHARVAPHIAEALLDEETRPRCVATVQGTMLIIRGFNTRPQSHPEDMFTVRAWIEGQRIITLQRDAAVRAVDDIRTQYEKAQGPVTPGDFVVTLADALIEHMYDVIERLEDHVDELERSSLSLDGNEDRIQLRLAALRHTIVPLRRYLAPQRDALAKLSAVPVDWLDKWQRSQLREVADEAVRYVEALDAIREDAHIVQDTLSARMASRMNRTVLVLSAVATIFLPLGLIAGLLGINVKGIPGADWDGAFRTVCAIMVVPGIIELWILRRLRML